MSLDKTEMILHLEELLRNNPKTFVSIMHANNEIGTSSSKAR